MQAKEEKQSIRDGRGNRLAANQKRINNRSFTLPEGRNEPNCKKITFMMRPSIYERCRTVAGDHLAEFIRDAIDLKLASIEKNNNPADS